MRKILFNKINAIRKRLFFTSNRNSIYVNKYPKTAIWECTRAKENLAVFFYNPSEVVIEKALEWFDEDNVKKI